MPGISVNNSTNIIADTIALVTSDGKAYVDLHQLVNTKSGPPPTDLSNLEQIASSINNDAFYYETVNQQLNNISNTLNTKLNIIDSNTTTASIINIINNNQYVKYDDVDIINNTSDDEFNNNLNNCANNIVSNTACSNTRIHLSYRSNRLCTIGEVIKNCIIRYVRNEHKTLLWNVAFRNCDRVCIRIECIVRIDQYVS